MAARTSDLFEQLLVAEIAAVTTALRPTDTQVGFDDKFRGLDFILAKT